MKEIEYADVAAQFAALDAKPFDHSIDGLILRLSYLRELADMVEDEIEAYNVVLDHTLAKNKSE